MDKLLPSDCPPDLGIALKVSQLLPDESDKFWKALDSMASEYEQEVLDLGKMRFKRELRTAEYYELTSEKWGLAPLQRIDFKQRQFYPRLLAILPEGLTEFFATSIFPFSTAIRYLKLWFGLRRILRTITRAHRLWEAGRLPSGQALPSWSTHELPPTPIGISDEGTLMFPGLPSINLFAVDPNILNRLRECPICLTLYWAKRIGGKRNEASTCEKKRCSNTFHQRKHRMRQYEAQLGKKRKELQKLSGLDPGSSLVTERLEAIAELEKKIRQEKEKNGDLRA